MQVPTVSLRKKWGGQVHGQRCNGKGLKSLEEGESKGIGAAGLSSQDCFWLSLQDCGATQEALGAGGLRAAIPNTLEIFVFQQHHLETVREKQLPGLPSQNRKKKSTLKTIKSGLFIPLLESSSPCNNREQKGISKREWTPSPAAARATCTAWQLPLLTRDTPKCIPKSIQDTNCT